MQNYTRNKYEDGEELQEQWSVQQMHKKFDFNMQMLQNFSFCDCGA